MLLGYNTNGLQNHRLEDALRLLADHGYQSVALTLDVGHLDPLHCSAAEIQRIAALLDKLGLHPVIETGARFVLDAGQKHEPTLMTRDPEGRRRRVEFYARCSRIGLDLGAQVLSFWAGVDRSPDAGSLDWLAEGVRQTVDAVLAVGLQPALEPEPGMAVETVRDYLGLRAKGLPELKLCLDIGHLYVTGEGLVGDILPGVSDLLVQVHLEDMQPGIHEHLPPGQGQVDFAEARRSLFAAGYQGPVCFELSRSSHQAPAMLTLCRDAWNRAAALT